MTDNRKDEIRDLNLDELESVAAGNFDIDKLTYEEEMLYFALKNRFIDLLVLQGQGKATFEEVCTAQKQFVDYSEQLKIKYTTISNTVITGTVSVSFQTDSGIPI